MTGSRSATLTQPEHNAEHTFVDTLSSSHTYLLLSSGLVSGMGYANQIKTRHKQVLPNPHTQEGELRLIHLQ